MENKDRTTDKHGGSKDKPMNWNRSRALQEGSSTANKPGDPITIAFGSVQLRLSDVQLLQMPRSINEAVVAFYFSFLQHDRYRCNTDIAFVPPDTSQCMTEMESDEMEPLFSLHELEKKLFGFFVFRDDHGTATLRGMNHFTLVIFSRPDKAYFYYDSCSNNSRNPSKRTTSFVRELSVLMNCRHWQLKAIRANVLLNTPYDCGVRIVGMTDNVANWVNRFESIQGIEPLHQDAVSAKRTEILKLVYMLGGKITL